MNKDVPVKKILIVGPAWVGDMVMAQTLFALLKQQAPCHITVMAGAWSPGLLAFMPEVDDVITVPFGHGDLNLLARWKLGVSLRDRDFDEVLILTNSWKSAIIPFAAKIPLRTGWRGEMRYGLLNDVRLLDKKKYPLMIDRFLALGLPEGETLPEPQWPRFRVNDAQVQQTLARFQLNSAGQNILVLCPGAEYGPAKRWPPAHFAEVAKSKLLDDWQVWLLGSSKEQPLASEIQRLTSQGCVDLTGQTNLAEAIDLLSQATAVVCNDTGLMHIAAALARPIVAVYGSSSPKFTPPLAEHVDIASINMPCSPCFDRVCRFGHTACLQDLSPQRILQGIEKLS